ncbi:hypothetical protein L3X38_020792 [Prunus dulcis]|uniref:Uncharacterized protein n=1 Tax=Prunus dulcis TaxID=3755 RepID=A0AAD4WEG8_PRUDU|nr:hypothetical protein L3X38_020792 [Prunus dulcis]
MTITMVSSFMKRVVDVRHIHPHHNLLVCVRVRSCILKSPHRHPRVPVVRGLAPLSTSLQSYLASKPSLCAGLGSLIHDLENVQPWYGTRINLGSNTNLMQGSSCPATQTIQKYREYKDKAVELKLEQR